MFQGKMISSAFFVDGNFAVKKIKEFAMVFYHILPKHLGVI